MKQPFPLLNYSLSCTTKVNWRSMNLFSRRRRKIHCIGISSTINLPAHNFCIYFDFLSKYTVWWKAKFWTVGRNLKIIQVNGKAIWDTWKWKSELKEGKSELEGPNQGSKDQNRRKQGRWTTSGSCGRNIKTEGSQDLWGDGTSRRPSFWTLPNR